MTSFFRGPCPNSPETGRRTVVRLQKGTLS